MKGICKVKTTCGIADIFGQRRQFQKRGCCLESEFTFGKTIGTVWKSEDILERADFFRKQGELWKREGHSGKISLFLASGDTFGKLENLWKVGTKEEMFGKFEKEWILF